MESPVERKGLYEYPTKFNKYRRMMEKHTTKTDGSDLHKDLSNDSTTNDFSSTALTSTGDTTPATPRDAQPHTGSQQMIKHNNNGLLQQPFHHSPPKKIFISRACDNYCQEVPLNLTTRSAHQHDDNASPKNCDDDGDEDKDDDDVDGDDSQVEVMDVNSMSENMIIEDHFKRSLGSLYTSQLKDLKPPPSYGHSNGVSTPNNNNNNNVVSDNNKFSTPSLSNHFNFAMSAVFSPIQLAPNLPFIPSSSSSSPTPHFPNHHFANLLNGSQIHDAQQYHGNRYLGNHLQAGNGFSVNLLFNGHPHQNHHHHQQQPQQEQSNKRLAPSSTSLHHSSSFNGVRPHKPSSPSSKSTTRHRFTPPDSYQPYPTDAKHRADAILKNSSADPSSVSGCVDDHFSKSLGEVWKQVKESHITAEMEDLIPTSVDDHFAKALGDKWFKLKSDHRPVPMVVDSPQNISTHSRNSNFFSSPSSFVVRS